MTERHGHHQGDGGRPADGDARLWGMYCAGADRATNLTDGEIDLMALAAWRDGRLEGDDAAAVEGMLAASDMPGVWLDDEPALVVVPPGVIASAKGLIDDVDQSAVVYVIRRPWRAAASMAAAIGLCVLGYRAGLQTAALPVPAGDMAAVVESRYSAERDFVADVSFGMLGDDGGADEVEAMVFAAELIGMIVPADDGMAGGDG